MKLKKLINRIKPPCSKCPYKLGLVESLMNPCPQCKRDNYSSYEWFRKQLAGEHPDVKNESE